MLQKLQQKKFARLMLVSIYGINICTANKIIGLLALHPLSRSSQLARLKYAEPLGLILDSLRIGFRLRLIVFSRICIQLFTLPLSYRAIRRLQGLPTKGQRTHANGKTPRRLKASGTNFPFNLKIALAKAMHIQRTLDASKTKKDKNNPKLKKSKLMQKKKHKNNKK